jgi:hypothetical protein
MVKRIFSTLSCPICESVNIFGLDKNLNVLYNIATSWGYWGEFVRRIEN